MFFKKNIVNNTLLYLIRWSNYRYKSSGTRLAFELGIHIFDKLLIRMTAAKPEKVNRYRTKFLSIKKTV